MIKRRHPRADGEQGERQADHAVQHPVRGAGIQQYERNDAKQIDREGCPNDDQDQPERLDGPLQTVRDRACGGLCLVHSAEPLTPLSHGVTEFFISLCLRVSVAKKHIYGLSHHSQLSNTCCQALIASSRRSTIMARMTSTSPINPNVIHWLTSCKALSSCPSPASTTPAIPA